MSIYDEMQKIASDVLSDPEFKQGVISYVRIVPGSGPEDDPGPANEIITPVLGGVVRGVSYKYVKDGLALSTDKIVTMPVVASIVPNMRDFIEVDGERLKIVQDISTPAAGVRVVWKFIVRKG